MQPTPYHSIPRERSPSFSKGQFGSSVLISYASAGILLAGKVGAIAGLIFV